MRTSIFGSLRCAALLALSATYSIGSAQPGTLDPTFNNVGSIVLAPNVSFDVGYGLVNMPGGDTYICGASMHNGSPQAVVTHLLNDGTLDLAFGTSGYTYVNPGLEAYAYDIALAPGGGLVMAGLVYQTFSYSEALLFKLDVTGALDNAFGTGGVVVTNISSLDAELRAIVITGSGRIVVGGRNGYGTSANPLFMAYTEDGVPDSTFGVNGVAQSNAFPADEDALSDITELADGSFVGCGYVNQNFANTAMLAKVSSMGVFDPGFGTNGVVVPALGGVSSEARGLVANGPGFFFTGVVDQTFNERNMIAARCNPDGTPSVGFGVNGIATVDIDANESAQAIAVQNDGKVLICGQTGPAGFMSPRHFVLARLTSTGLLDVGFGTNNGYTITPFGNTASLPYGIALTADNKIVLAGVAAYSQNDIVAARYLNDDLGVAVPSVAVRSGQRLYPQPCANGLVHLRASERIPAGTRITVRTMLGKVVADMRSEPVDADGVLPVHLGALPPGQYVLSVGLVLSTPLAVQ